MPAKPKKGDRVRVVVGSAQIVGVVARNDRHLPNPYRVDVDLEASTFPADEAEARAYFALHYAGPYQANELVKVA